ncbi:MAG TPA: TetR/AcrR family transcriptional regulator [Polyangiaceae bacterium]|nr:TetR/AcrR family transcriptional regulator [Polyangiaceae bacterium]
MSVPVRRRTYKPADERKAQILDCALRAFAEGGYHATSIADVCARAGIGRATLYQYFEDKRALLVALTESIAERIVAAVRNREPLEIPQGFRPSREQAVSFTRERIVTVLRAAFGDPSTIRLVLRAGRGTDGMVDTILRRIDDVVLEVMEADLRAAQEAGVLRPIDARFVARFLLGGYEKVLLMYVDEDRPIDFDRIAGDAALLEMCGLFKQE